MQAAKKIALQLKAAGVADVVATLRGRKGIEPRKFSTLRARRSFRSDPDMLFSSCVLILEEKNF
jgi:hypothetical protein